MELVRQQRNGSQLLVGDLDARRIFVGVQLGAYFQPLIGLGVSNQIDYYLMAPEWPAALVLADKGEEPMLDLVPFAGARRKVAHREVETGLVGESTQAYAKTFHSGTVIIQHRRVCDRPGQ